jgi:hypothetical protein
MARHDGTHDSRDFAPMTKNLQINADTFQQPQSGDQVQALQRDLPAQPAAARRLSHEVDVSSSKVDVPRANRPVGGVFAIMRCRISLR